MIRNPYAVCSLGLVNGNSLVFLLSVNQPPGVAAKGTGVDR